MATILIIDAGARGHAISKAYERSKQVRRIIVAPGNDFIAYRRTKEVIVEKKCTLIDPNSILNVAQSYQPDIIDIAQDDALASGSVDLLREHGFRVFGPTRQASRIEWDKKWSKEFMLRHTIPTAQCTSFSVASEAISYVTALYQQTPHAQIFVKATGLCAGKGALIAQSLNEAIDGIQNMKSFGIAGETFLIEEGLVGEEFSCYAISDGNSYRVFKSAQDNKKSHNFDLGDQTGGMGAISPAQITEPFTTQIEESMISRAISGMASEGNPYEGILYIGGIVVKGEPFVIEYNARWGDPECQAVLPSVTTDYFELVNAVIEKRLDKISVQQDSKQRVCVVGALRGYPGDYSKNKGSKIFGLDTALTIEGVNIFSAGISLLNEDFLAGGGRLFSIVGEGNSIIEARQRAYAAMAHIHIEGNNLHYRTDIGWKDVERYYKETI